MVILNIVRLLLVVAFVLNIVALAKANWKGEVNWALFLTIFACLIRETVIILKLV